MLGSRTVGAALLALALVSCPATPTLGAASAESCQAVQAACAQLLEVPSSQAALQRLGAQVNGIADGDLKASVLAAYALGLFYADQTQAGAKIVLSLQQGFPDCPHLPLFQGARYQTACAVCSGVGKVDTACTHCSGSGACIGCRGRGTVPRLNSVSAPCVACRGSGQCSYCRGTRRTMAVCSRCSGQGRFTSKPLMKEAFLGLVRQTAELALDGERAAKGLVLFEGQWVEPAERQRELDRRDAVAKAEATRKAEELARAQAEELARAAAAQEAQRREEERLALAAASAATNSAAQPAGPREGGELADLRARAEAGDATAQYQLGLRYDRGNGVAQDYGEAASWYRKAAEQGEASALYNLGVFYANGQGVAQDVRTAKSWFARASSAGSRDAAGALRYLASTGGAASRGPAAAESGEAAPDAARPAAAGSLGAPGGASPTWNPRQALPAYAGGELSGRDPVRIRNPNAFAVSVGLRSSGKGKDFDVPAKGRETVEVPNGRYDIFFAYSHRTNALFQGDSFTLNNNGVEIQIVAVEEGNYGIRQVK